MNVNNDIFRTVIESEIQQALAAFESNNNGDTLSNLSIKIDRENGKMLVYDDLENLLSEGALEIWNDDDDPEQTTAPVVRRFKQILHGLSKQGVFDKEFIFKPFSVNLIDEDTGRMEELLFPDGDMLKPEGDSLIDLDKELNNFLKDLLDS
jgi:hypothetical protein